MMENKNIFAALAVAGALSVASNVTPVLAAPQGGGMHMGGGGMHMGGGGMRMGGGGGGTHFGGSRTHFGGGFREGGFRGRGFGSGLALGALGFGLGYPYYAYGDYPYYYDNYGYDDCYAPRRVWWHGGWHWQRVYAC
jgi:hypothetical protein